MTPSPGISLSLFITGVLLLAAGCNKTGSSAGPTGGNGTTTTTTTLDPGDTAIVYIAGTAGNTIYCWRNDIVSQLSAPPPMNLSSGYEYANIAYVSGIALSDTDIYISGGYLTNDTLGHQGYTAAYWKNGVPSNLHDSAQAAQSHGIAVSAGNVVIAGTETYYEPNVAVPYSDFTPFMKFEKYGSIAMSWTNGTPAYVNTSYAYAYDEHDTGLAFLPDYVTGIAVSGSDVYLAGGVTSWSAGVSSSMHFTAYWKNGNLVDLPNGFTGTTPTDSTGWFSPKVTGIAVSGSHVYACGTEYTELGKTGSTYNIVYQATMWKDSALIYLGSKSDYSQAYGICVSGTDVYVAGTLGIGGSNNHAVYWKNGTPVTLDNTPGSSAIGVAVAGNNVYAVGYIGLTAILWRNGKAYPLKTLRTLAGIVARFPGQR